MSIETQATYPPFPNQWVVAVLRLLGSIAGIYAGFLLWGYSMSMTEDAWLKFDHRASIISTGLAFLLASWLLWTAYRSWLPAQVPPVRSVSVVFGIAFSYLVTTPFAGDCASGQCVVDPSTSTLVMGFVDVLLFAIAYVAMSWWLCVGLGIQDRRQRVPDPLICIVALFGWGTAVQLLTRWLSSNQDTTGLAGWQMPVVFIAPLIAVVILGRQLRKIGAHSPPAHDEALPPC